MLTPAEIAAERGRVVAAAKSWLRTPYHHMGRLKGVGVDCAMLLAEVYAEAGVIARVDPKPYPPDWHLHRDAERYLGVLLDHAVEIEGPPQPGDAALWRFGRCFSHGAIVAAWPVVIHARPGGVVTDDAERALWLTTIGEASPERGRPRPRRFYTLKRWAAP